MMTTITTLPREIILEIINHFTVSDLLNFQLANKHFSDTISEYSLSICDDIANKYFPDLARHLPREFYNLSRTRPPINDRLKRIKLEKRIQSPSLNQNKITDIGWIVQLEKLDSSITDIISKAHLINDIDFSSIPPPNDDEEDSPPPPPLPPKNQILRNFFIFNYQTYTILEFPEILKQEFDLINLQYDFSELSQHFRLILQDLNVKLQVIFGITSDIFNLQHYTDELNLKPLHTNLYSQMKSIIDSSPVFIQYTFDIMIKSLHPINLLKIFSRNSDDGEFSEDVLEAFRGVIVLCVFIGFKYAEHMKVDGNWNLKWENLLDCVVISLDDDEKWALRVDWDVQEGMKA